MTKQLDFDGNEHDNRTPKQKRLAKAQAKPKQSSMFNGREEADLRQSRLSPILNGKTERVITEYDYVDDMPLWAPEPKDPPEQETFLDA